MEGLILSIRHSKDDVDDDDEWAANLKEPGVSIPEYIPA